MLRRIVLLRKHEWLAEGAKARSFTATVAAARSRGVNLTSQYKVKGSELDESYHPVPVTGIATVGPEGRQPAVGFDYAFTRPRVREQMHSYAVRSTFSDEEAIQRFKRDRGDEVVGVFADPTISPCPSYCGDNAVGAVKDVASALKVAALKKKKLTGKNVRVAVVDTGVDEKYLGIKVAGGWGPSTAYVPGSTKVIVDEDVSHGTMCAFDVLISAPKARILDYALLQAGGNWTAFLSDAVAAFADLMNYRNAHPGTPLVVTNSWCMFNRSEDAPIGSPENYSANPNHPFNQITGSLVAAGADVLFAAGNCGKQCPDGRCGKKDVGPGKSIHGANSHPSVITVAGITVKDTRVGYSSQGPGALYNKKPDIAAFTHFTGSGVFSGPDAGTSAACPVAAGVVAALRQKFKPTALPPAQLKGALQRSARDLGGKGWDYNHGYGALDAAAALKALT
jgi:subtilisin family serine protease